MIRADAAFAIGKTHAVCEDYALAAGEQASGVASVWLSDGCSSSPNTDIGARLLTHRMAQQTPGWAGNLPEQNLDQLLRRNAQAAIRLAKSMGLPATCADATLLGLVAAPGSENIYAVLCGDGALACGHRNGTRTVHHVKYAANYPFYPAYLADTERKGSWQRVGGNACACTRTVLNGDGTEQSAQTTYPVEKLGLVCIPRANLLWAAVVSDGVESVQRPGQNPGSFVSVPYRDVVAELTAFKNFTGAFAQRRLQRWEKETAKRGWHHSDDLSIAALYFGDEG